MIPSKYKNKKTIVDGIKFDSLKEARRYKELKLLEKAGIIKHLELQVKYELQPRHEIKSKKVSAITYIADFRYYDCENDKVVVEDVKGFKTEIYKLKAKMFSYKFGFEITEV